MVRTILFLAFTITISYPILAQKAYFDSLSVSVMTIKEDSNKLKLLTELVREYQSIDANKTVDYAKQMLELAYLYNDDEKIIKAQHALGKAFLKQSKYQEALLYYNRTISQIIKVDSSAYVSTLRDSYFDIGTIYNNRFQPKIALDFYQKSLKIASQQGTRWNIAKTEFEIGNTFIDDENYIRAIVYYKKAEKSFIKIKFPTGAVKALVAIGQSYLAEEDDNQSLYHFKKALTYAKKSGSDKDIGYAKEYLASFYFNKKFYRECYDWQREAMFHYQDAKDSIQYANLLSSFGLTLDRLDSSETALKQELEALKIFRKVNHQVGIAQSLNRLGEYYYYYLDEIDVIDYLTEAININKSLNDQPNLAKSLISLSKFYYSKKNYRKVLPTANNAFKISKELNLTNEIIKSSDLLAETYTKLKDFENAVLFQRISKETSQSAGLQEIEELSKRTKSTRKQYEQEAKKAKSNSIWKYVVFVLVLILGLMGYYIWKLYKTSKTNQQLVSELNEHLNELKRKK
jgi:tetratricopeptide (TPR) repeat protein